VNETLKLAHIEEALFLNLAKKENKKVQRILSNTICVVEPAYKVCITWFASD